MAVDIAKVATRQEREAKEKRTSEAGVPALEPISDGDVNASLSPEAIEQRAAIDLIETIQQDASQKGVLHTERGLTIYLRKVNRNIVADAWAKIPDPEVPKWIDPDKSDPEQGINVEVENPNDPAYRKRLDDVQLQRARVATTVNIALGVRAISGIEEAGLVHWDEDSWLEYVRYTDLEIPPVGSKVRMVSWMRYYALTNQDLGNLSLAVGVFSNSMLREADVEIAERSFRC